MLFSLLKHHFDLNITDTALKVSRSFYSFTASISHGVENYFPRLWGTGVSLMLFSTYWVAMGFFWKPMSSFITPQPSKAVEVLFSPMVSGWAGACPGGWRREKVCPD